MRSAIESLVRGSFAGETWALTPAVTPAAAGDEGVDRWVPSICGFCGVGCGLFIGLRNGQAVAVKGAPFHPVNQGRLCAKGIYEWKTIHHRDRATRPMVRRGEHLEATSWDDAMEVVTTRIRKAMAEGGPDAVGVYLGGQLLLEESYALGKLCRAVIGTRNFDSSVRLCMASSAYGYIRTFGSDGAPGSYEDLDLADCIMVFGCNPAEMQPVLWQRILDNRTARGGRLIVVDPRRTLPAAVADLHLRPRLGTNVALLNGLLNLIISRDLVDEDFVREHTLGFDSLRSAVRGYTPSRVERTCGVPAEELVQAALTFGRSRSAVTLFAQGVNQSPGASDAAGLICAMHLITGKVGKPGSAPLAITGQCGSMGVREAGGALFLPGYRDPANPGHRAEVARRWGIDPAVIPASYNDITKMVELIHAGEIEFLWVIGSNPAVTLPDQGYVRRALQKVFLVVQDLFYPMETARFADVFLPAAHWGEKTGTLINAERRVALTRKAVEPPGVAKTDLEIFMDLAVRLGARHLVKWAGPEDVFEEWKSLSAGRPDDVSGLSYARLESTGGIQWPCPGRHPQGTPRLYLNGVFNTRPEVAQMPGQVSDTRGRAFLWPAKAAPLAEVPDAEYPLLLNTGRILEHYHSRTKTKRIPELNSMVPGAFAEINEQDAQRLGIASGDTVRVSSRRGAVEVEARVSDCVRPGEVFVPFHFGDLDPGEDSVKQAANHLTGRFFDPFSRQPLFKYSTCRVEKIPPRDSEGTV